ncbi:hypothetical protein [Pedobacter rhodius]|uniref:Uncharacterized protein n=1 Tax=Pedobacter rhodius TaxID=3004098 RepID=A0ABT4KUL4_9SPHI|nr:hypothetical protein [Pedobacter sp. SJ11]MCZ4222611.1 hypothetical protein [Pedobacter sp. SJ11]
MNTIIENQKIKSFFKKMDLEWPDKIERISFKTEDLIFVHLQDNISPVEFAESLMPKVKVFVDFSTPIKICFLNTEGEGNSSLVFN